MTKWFLVKDGKELGPLTSNQLKELAASGQIQPDTLVRREDKAAAVLAGKINGLLPAQSAPQAPPPVQAPVPQVPPEQPKRSPPNDLPSIMMWAGGLVALAFCCCGGFCCLGVLTPDGVGGATAQTSFTTENEFRALVMGKSSDEVIAAVGKPGVVHPSGRFVNGEWYDESWVYYKRLTHKATGQRQDLQVFFTDDRVIETGIK